MDSKLERPKFTTDEEESEWWFAHRDQISEEAVQAFASGKIRQSGPISSEQEFARIPMDTHDREMAKSTASKRGIAYETYLKTLLHEAVQRDANAA